MAPELTLTNEMLTGIREVPRRGGQPRPVAPRLEKFITRGAGCAQSCWSWHGSTDSTRHPKISVCNRIVSARRIIYALAHGHHVPAVEIRMTCGGTAPHGRPCVSPNHMKLRKRSADRRWRQV